MFTLSAQVKLFVTGLFSLNQDIPAFKEHLRDFLVQIKVCLAYAFFKKSKLIVEPDNTVRKYLGSVQWVFVLNSRG